MPAGFVRIATAAEIRPGQMKRFDIDGHAVLLANVDGRYYAVDDTCTHEDASLSGGVLKGALVRCPLHGSRFDLRTGAALEEPAEDALRTYAVKIEGGRLKVRCPAKRSA